MGILLIAVLASGSGPGIALGEPGPLRGRAVHPAQGDATELRAYPPLAPEDRQLVREALEEMKSDRRGPYLRIRWFCNDGTVLPPEPYACRDHGGGHQRAEFTPRAERLADLGFHVGTILTAMPYEEFVDAGHGHYRLRELVVEEYLIRNDDGWVLREARYYRGARQIEDETGRGRRFLVRLLDDPSWRARHPLLARRVAAVVPHGQPGVPGDRIRTLATRIAELDPDFQDLRIKIHSRPGPDDREAVAEYRDSLPEGAAAELRQAVAELSAGLRDLYPDQLDAGRWSRVAESLQGTRLAEPVARARDRLQGSAARAKVSLLSSLVLRARDLFQSGRSGTADVGGEEALALLDFLNYVEPFLVTSASSWIQRQSDLMERPGDTPAGGEGAGTAASGGAPADAGLDPAGSAATRTEVLAFVEDLVDAAYGFGWFTVREYHALSRAARLHDPAVPLPIPRPAPGRSPTGGADQGRGSNRAAHDGTGGEFRLFATASPDDTRNVPVSLYHDVVSYLGRGVEWGQGAIHQTFGTVLERYVQVEPAVTGFRDDELRRSILLPFAAAVDLLTRDASRAVDRLHSVFGVETAGRVTGLNSGMAMGRLRIVEDLQNLQELDLAPGDICVLPETPADLGHVAGIMTLNEGSRLSHVQLLARSMGIPNAVISEEMLPVLREHAGDEIFYGVSRLGTVTLKTRDQMTSRELSMLEEEAERRASGRIAIDLEELDLAQTDVRPLESLDLEDSGRIVGPKAANLARLHRLFPNRVAPGLVLPFGIFRAHVDRDLLGTGRTLYEEIVDTFRHAERARARGDDPDRVEERVLERLHRIRRAILDMELLPEFVSELERMLADRFGPPGSYGVFVRSDTNVEDLPDFTGAGLNLTMMNQIGTESILESIKKVWASPFSERSYTWRQSRVTTPEHVYPSIILLKSVPVEASGVVVTTDLLGERPGLWTVTLSEGIGGVVEGEPAETTLVPAAGGAPILLSSARAVWRKVLNTGDEGGIQRVPVEGHAVLLTPRRLADLRQVVGDVQARYPPATSADGAPLPWDIEFGFVDDEVMLFQIRPLVTDRRVELLNAAPSADSTLPADETSSIDLHRAPGTR